MSITGNQTSLVIIGAWNPAILNPEWLTKEIFKKAVDSKTPVRMEFATNPVMPPKYTIEDITFVPGMDRLMIIPQNLEDINLQSVEEKAIELLNTLSHTPILAFGQNYEFTVNDLGEKILSDFTKINETIINHVEQKELVTSQITTSHKNGNSLLHFTRIFSKGSMLLKFNFHYDVISAHDAIEKMKGAFVKNINTIKQILRTYDIDITDTNEVLDE